MMAERICVDTLSFGFPVILIQNETFPSFIGSLINNLPSAASIFQAILENCSPCLNGNVFGSTSIEYLRSKLDGSIPYVSFLRLIPKTYK